MDERLFFPATERNSYSIHKVLTKYLPKNGFVLEIASGSGEHAVTFQKLFPGITWQTSDPVIVHRKSISAWIRHKGLEEKMPPPINIDVEQKPWDLSEKIKLNLKFIVCINLLHISSWSCTESLFEESSNQLKKGDSLMLYGPFKINGEHTSSSNQLFDRSLKSKNQKWGVRDLETVHLVAKTNGFEKLEFIEMPANNLSVIFRKI